jgi:uncharacterized Zn-binding protein involved in type VI secretion
MSSPVAKKGDRVVGLDTHIVLIPSPGGPIPTPIPSSFSGPLQSKLASTVYLDGEPVAIVGSVADNTPPHIPIGGSFQSPPSNRGTVVQGSTTVFADEKGVVRAGDPVECCNDPTDLQTGVVVAAGKVFAG